MKNETISALVHFKTVLTSAIYLKERFDKKEPLDALKNALIRFTKDLSYLETLIPKEILEESNVYRHHSWIHRRLEEGKPELCEGDVYNLCYNDISYAEKLYLKHIQSITPQTNTDVGFLTEQLKKLESSECDATAWITITQKGLTKIFPDDGINLSKMKDIKVGYGFTVVERRRYAELLKGYIDILDSNIKQESYSDKWDQIHKVISQVSKSRFETNHYADAVEAAFKEINDVIKKAYHLKVGKEEDGDVLMRRSFSVNAPVFLLSDNTTESGKNIQQGYMDIFAGSMKGIRNPKAHANLNVHPEEAWEMIVLASHLMRMWDKYNLSVK